MLHNDKLFLHVRFALLTLITIHTFYHFSLLQCTQFWYRKILYRFQERPVVKWDCDVWRHGCSSLGPSPKIIFKYLWLLIIDFFFKCIHSRVFETATLRKSNVLNFTEKQKYTDFIQRLMYCEFTLRFPANLLVLFIRFCFFFWWRSPENWWLRCPVWLLYHK